MLVNDVAAVNVDAMSARRTTIEENGVEMVQLENGCVCARTRSGDLAPAADARAHRAFDHVVVELSGVADPINVQNNLVWAASQWSEWRRRCQRFRRGTAR